jgi:hypothetical protein
MLPELAQLRGRAAGAGTPAPEHRQRLRRLKLAELQPEPVDDGIEPLGPLHDLVTIPSVASAAPRSVASCTTSTTRAWLSTRARVEHWHVWRLSAGPGAFASRAYLTRTSAKAAAERWSGVRGLKRRVESSIKTTRAAAFVHRCELGEFCPRPPRISDVGRQGDAETR